MQFNINKLVKNHDSCVNQKMGNVICPMIEKFLTQ